MNKKAPMREVLYGYEKILEMDGPLPQPKFKIGQSVFLLKHRGECIDWKPEKVVITDIKVRKMIHTDLENVVTAVYDYEYATHSVSHRDVCRETYDDEHHESSLFTKEGALAHVSVIDKEKMELLENRLNKLDSNPSEEKHKKEAVEPDRTKFEVYKEQIEELETYYEKIVSLKKEMSAMGGKGLFATQRIYDSLTSLL